MSSSMSCSHGIAPSAMALGIGMMKSAALVVPQAHIQHIGMYREEPPAIYVDDSTDIISVADSDGSPLSQQQDDEEVMATNSGGVVVPDLASIVRQGEGVIVAAPAVEGMTIAIPIGTQFGIIEQQQQQQQQQFQLQQQQQQQQQQSFGDYAAAFGANEGAVETPYEGPDIEVSNATDVGFVLTVYGYRVYVALEKIINMDEDCDAVFTVDGGQMVSISYGTMKQAIRMYAIAREHTLLRRQALAAAGAAAGGVVAGDEQIVVVASASTAARAAAADELALSANGAAQDLLAVAMSDSELYTAATPGGGVVVVEAVDAEYAAAAAAAVAVDDELFPYPLPVMPAPAVANVTCETHVLLNQAPIMSTAETPGRGGAQQLQQADGTEAETSAAANVDECHAPMNLEESLAVIGISQPTGMLPMLELPITVTNPEIATRVLNQMDVYDVGYVADAGSIIDAEIEEAVDEENDEEENNHHNNTNTNTTEPIDEDDEILGDAIDQ